MTTGTVGGLTLRTTLLSAYTEIAFSVSVTLKRYRVDMPERRLKFGGAIHLELAVQLNGLHPDDVTVEALFGRPGRNGGIGRVRHYPLTCVGQGEHGAMRYTLELTPELCGKLEYRIRAFPTHASLIHPLETGLMIWL